MLALRVLWVVITVISGVAFAVLAIGGVADTAWIVIVGGSLVFSAICALTTFALEGSPWAWRVVNVFSFLNVIYLLQAVLNQAWGAVGYGVVGFISVVLLADRAVRVYSGLQPTGGSFLFGKKATT